MRKSRNLENTGTLECQLPDRKRTNQEETEPSEDRISLSAAGYLKDRRAPENSPKGKKHLSSWISQHLTMSSSYSTALTQ